ncbi:tRNA1(Val) (adenine(37)-N6)-methyltransferase [Veillonella montpellierensis]|uniref:tRNA1(Val) (adenine(37)-N6)-methyltransferase n=1 Tax=Veillonella montpellierensis TaxID=187328 RepID=UPI0023F87434|nr:hypothetical protein [Veillonella montpellierensis]
MNEVKNRKTMNQPFGKNFSDSSAQLEIALKEQNLIDTGRLLRDPRVRLDDIIIDDMKLYQRSDQFCFSIDAVILANFIPYKAKDSYVELGTGTGIIPLLATAKGCRHIVGVEKNPTMALLATCSVDYNKKKESIQIIQGDYRQLATWQMMKHVSVEEIENTQNHSINSVSHNYKLDSKSSPYKKDTASSMVAYIPYKVERHFDGVIANPPYYGVNCGALSQHRDRALALHEDDTSLDEVIQAAKRLVKYKGKYWMIYVADRISYVLRLLEAHGFAPKRIRFVHSFPHQVAKLVLVEAVQGGKEGVMVEPPLYIYQEKNVYSKEVSDWYGEQFMDT